MPLLWGMTWAGPMWHGMCARALPPRRAASGASWTSCRRGEGRCELALTVPGCTSPSAAPACWPAMACCARDSVRPLAMPAGWQLTATAIQICA